MFFRPLKWFTCVYKAILSISYHLTSLNTRLPYESYTHAKCEQNACVSVYFSGVLERLESSVERQHHLMTTRGLLEPRSSLSEEEGEEPLGGAHLSREELQQLVRRAQLWPLMEQLAVLNQLRLSTDLLHLALSPGYEEKC